jgi:ABC-type lipoprotein release transport system permease subunit
LALYDASTLLRLPDGAQGVRLKLDDIFAAPQVADDTLKIPTTLKRLKRGTTPAGDGVASGKTNVTLSFRRTIIQNHIVAGSLDSLKKGEFGIVLGKDMADSLGLL